MGNAALLAREAGHQVLGADTGVYPPMSTVLANAGIELHEGYDPLRLQTLAPDLVVIGNAMSRGNVEVEWLLDSRAIPFVSLPAMLNEFVLRHRRNVVVCGTHGKTTTTALTSFLLRENGRDPGFLIGGVPQDPPTGNHLGALKDPFVIEGDEYDSAFFDKRSKFIHYAPRIAVLNNLEFDHADIFRDLKDVQRTFIHLSRIVPRSGCIVMNGDDENLKALEPITWTRVIRVGLGEHNDVRILGFTESPEGSRFRLEWHGQPWAEISWHLPGIFNARNAAMASTAAGLALAGDSKPGAPTDVLDPRGLSLDCLSHFRGVKRRQEQLIHTKDLTVIEDFGHHPTALAETLRSFRARFPGYRLTAVFEPRSNTARTKALQSDFMHALALADEVYLGAVNRPEKLKDDERFDPLAVTRSLEAQKVSAFCFPSNAALLDELKARTLHSSVSTTPRLLVFFTNGSFDGIIAKFCSAARN
jgi:UDP-N-acetylmuramate: L-alanyl-gamma-D-glutamyl-meso-diaminopimelate ligase